MLPQSQRPAKHRASRDRRCSVAAGKAQRVYVWAVGRVDRMQRREHHRVSREGVAAGGIVVSVNEPWFEQEPESAQREILQSMTAFIALEANNLHGLTRANLARDVASGKTVTAGVRRAKRKRRAVRA